MVLTCVLLFSFNHQHDHSKLPLEKLVPYLNKGLFYFTEKWNYFSSVNNACCKLEALA